MGVSRIGASLIPDEFVKLTGALAAVASLMLRTDLTTFLWPNDQVKGGTGAFCSFKKMRFLIK
jgi:hypothetical protein